VRGPLGVLVRIRLSEVLRRPSTAFWFFVLPTLLVFLVAIVFRNGHPFERRVVLMVGDASAIEKSLASHVEAGRIQIERVPTEDIARARLRTRSVSAYVVPREPPEVVVGERDLIFGRGLAMDLAPGAHVTSLDLPETGYVTFLIPGMFAQGVVIAGLWGMGHAMVRYRQSRFLRKLATTPIHRWEFVLAQVIARVVLVTLQLLVLLLVARLGFDVPLSATSIGWVLVTGAAGLVTFMGIGFVLSCLIKTEDLVIDIINLVSVPIALLSEIFFSNDTLPRALALFSAALPSTQMVRVMRAVLLHGEAATSTTVATGLAILAVWAVVSFTIAVRAFRWR
jgi:ABC transporter DrrB family efflux protein